MGALPGVFYSKPKLEAYKQLPIDFTGRAAVSKHADKPSLAIASCFLQRAETGEKQQLCNQ